MGRLLYPLTKSGGKLVPRRTQGCDKLKAATNSRLKRTRTLKREVAFTVPYYSVCFKKLRMALHVLCMLQYDDDCHDAEGLMATGINRSCAEAAAAARKLKV